MALTDASVRAAKPRADGRPSKLYDGDGLLLLVTGAGAKYWRFKYRFAGKEKQLALGVYRRSPSSRLAKSAMRSGRF